MTYYAADLKRAASIIETVISGLDMSTDVCGHCNVTKYANRDEAQMHKELGAIVRKLYKFAGRPIAKQGTP